MCVCLECMCVAVVCQGNNFPGYSIHIFRIGFNRVFEEDEHTQKLQNGTDIAEYIHAQLMVLSWGKDIHVHTIKTFNSKIAIEMWNSNIKLLN